MSIQIEKVGSLYIASVSPPHGEAWVTPVPLSRSTLVAALLGQGCHQTDIGDAFYEADPGWLNESENQGKNS